MELRVVAILGIDDANRWMSLAMPQMFDWIFFAIMLPFPAFLVWDYLANRAPGDRPLKQILFGPAIRGQGGNRLSEAGLSERSETAAPSGLA
ncbi:hypothetical protein [Methylobacterium symbioticum]|nr:hypothetical protein [Methylobacterium symbioticum]